MSVRAPRASLAAHARSRLDAVLAAGMARLALAVPTAAGEPKRRKQGFKKLPVQDEELDELNPDDLDELAVEFEQQKNPSGVRRAPLRFTDDAKTMLVGLVKELVANEGEEGQEGSMSSRAISARTFEIAREIHEQYPALEFDQLHAFIRDTRKKYSARRIGKAGGSWGAVPEDPMYEFNSRDIREVKEALKPPPPRPAGRVPQREKGPGMHLNLVNNEWMVPEVANLPAPPPIPEGESSGGRGPYSRANQRKWTHAENAYVYWYVMHPWELEIPRQRAAMMRKLQCEKTELQDRVRRVRQYVEKAHPGSTVTPDLLRKTAPEDDPMEKLLAELLPDDPKPEVVSPPPTSPRTLPAPSPPPALL